VADVVICSLCLSYMQDPFPAIREMARITRPGGRVVISDLHGDAERAGWKRSFRAGGIEYELLHRPHSRDVLVEHAKLAGLALVWQTAPCFGEPERHVFRSAGKENLFEPASQVSALQAIGWRRL
jgi:SAM-dependent methyltransferase